MLYWTCNWHLVARTINLTFVFVYIFVLKTPNIFYNEGTPPAHAFKRPNVHCMYCSNFAYSQDKLVALWYYGGWGVTLVLVEKSNFPNLIKSRHVRLVLTTFRIKNILILLSAYNRCLLIPCLDKVLYYSRWHGVMPLVMDSIVRSFLFLIVPSR